MSILLPLLLYSQHRDTQKIARRDAQAGAKGPFCRMRVTVPRKTPQRYTSSDNDLHKSMAFQEAKSIHATRRVRLAKAAVTESALA